MPKPEKKIGEYHFAVKVLEAALAKTKKRPEKFKNPQQRAASITRALDVLRINDMPSAYDPNAPLVPQPIAE